MKRLGVFCCVRYLVYLESYGLEKFTCFYCKKFHLCSSSWDEVPYIPGCDLKMEIKTFWSILSIDDMRKIESSDHNSQQ